MAKKMKFHDYSGIKNAKDNPRCKAPYDMSNGEVVVYSVNASGVETIARPTNAADAKIAKHFVWNTIDKPELDNEDDYKIKAGEYARIFEIAQGVPMDISKDLVVTTTVNVGDVLVPRTVSTATDSTDVADGLLEVSTATGYATRFKVTEKSTYGESGFVAVTL